jgi:hypothetical protein
MMISITLNYWRDLELAAFPNVLVSLIRMDDLRSGTEEIKTLLNRPGLDHWILSVEKGVSLKDILDHFTCGAYADMSKLFEIYTFIPVGNRRSLKRKMSRPRYFRSIYSDSLHNLKWVSAKYVYAGVGQVLFMQSPILIFGNSVSSFFADSWFSAFVSLLRTGVLELVVHHAHFCLGTFKISPSDLSSKQLIM